LEADAKRGAQMKTPESAVLRACLEYLRIRRHLVSRINNGAFETKRGGWVRCTDTPGLSDILGITFDDKALAVEVKSEKGRLSRHQEIYRAAFIARGGLYRARRTLCRGEGR
jgi:hypothetical protein